MNLSSDIDNDLKVSHTRKCLFDSFVTLLETMSFRKISVSQICETAGVHRSTFYSHFENKIHLLTFGISGLIDDVTSRLENQRNPEISESFKHVMMYRQFYRSILNSSDSEIVKLFREQIAMDFRLKMKSNLEDNDFCLQIKSRVCAGAFIAVIDWLISRDNLYEIETVSDEFQRILMNGLWYNLHLKTSST